MRTVRVSVVLMVLGAALVALPFIPRLADALDAQFREVRLLELVLGFALVFIALILRDLGGIRRRDAEVLALLRRALHERGNPASHNEAVDILLQALQGPEEAGRKAAYEQLKRLTGRDFGLDAQKWAQWRATPGSSPGDSRDGGGAEETL